MAIKRTRLAAAALAAAAAVLAAAFFLRSGDRGRAAAPSSRPAAFPVPVRPVVAQTVPVYLSYVGATDAIRSVSLLAQVPGYLQKRLVPDASDVKAGELLYQIDPRPYQAALDQAKAQLEKDAAAREYAELNRERNAKLHKTGDVSTDTLQLSVANERQDTASVDADRAAIEAAGLNLSYTQIRAPFAGRLSYSQVYEGSLITTANTPINTLVQLDPIYATFNPPDTDLPQIRAAQAKAPIPVEVTLGVGQTAHYHGRLTFLDNSVSRSSATIVARATIENPDHMLLPGQIVSVRLEIAEQPNTLLVPQAAVNSSQLGQYVYVVGKGGTLEERFVTLGPTYGTSVEVTKGVAKGEEVVVDDLLKVGPGMAVKAVPAGGAPS
jgi:multidrug efflux system membrane fusion protein